MHHRTFYRVVFVAAGLYNVAFGAVMLAKPELITEPLQLAALHEIATQYSWLWNAIAASILGMSAVYLFAVAQLESARWLIALGLLTKLLPPLCWIAAVVAGVLPTRALLLPLINDVIWWPAFVSFLRREFALNARV